MALISVVTPCFNEEENILEIYRQVKAVFFKLGRHQYEHLFIDNSSSDRTLEILKELAARDHAVKVIVNTRDFGHMRSPYHAYMQAKGDAVIAIVADLQNPPELIETFVEKWEQGFKVVVGIKEKSDESFVVSTIKKLYYKTIRALSDVDLLENYMGYGLYDRVVIETLRRIGDPYPYFRGMVAETGYECAKVPYAQPRRIHGRSKHNFYILFDTAMLGMTSYTRIPLRIATMAGVFFAVVSFGIGLFYMMYKLLFWESFSVGLAPVVIGLFFLGSVQLIFLGVLGEYIGAIHTRVSNRPLVVEKERINFDVAEG